MPLLFIISIISFGIILLVFTVKILKKRSITVNTLGKLISYYSLLLFVTPWIYWLYHLIEVEFKTSVYDFHEFIRHPIILLIEGMSLIYLCSGIGIYKFKNWCRIVSIIITALMALLSLGFWIISLCSLYEYFFIPGDMDTMVNGIFGFIIGPLVLVVVLLPTLLFLYCLTRSKVKEQFKKFRLRNT